MSGLSRHMGLSVRSLKFTGSSVPTKSLRAAAVALPGKVCLHRLVPPNLLKQGLYPGTRTLTNSRLTTRQAPYFQEHLNHVFAPLHFPEELAKRILTHGSHSASIGGHNAGLSFIGVLFFSFRMFFQIIYRLYASLYLGRRVLEAYLQLFLHSSSALDPSDDLEEILNSTLATNFLGEFVGPEWGVGRVIRWSPSAPAQKLANMDREVDTRRQVGLYKVQGEAVEAILGGIYFQFVS